eukprot:CAMPEP_0170556604 /NCGR_PEP_ID=MMETSP0211-20121228/17706_1 /TAXON_ID=311385 /ORGANISM="Pseudokeronopsis sp., Strain OXSARD2" /LENGTH=150 /DNA_ID=CAMNT_0010867039 /DNA_START=18 /DNA_END=470 /DNA_ORIENTATION=+
MEDIQRRWTELRALEKANAAFLVVYLIEFLVLGFKTFRKHSIFYAFILAYPHVILLSYNYLLLFTMNIQLKKQLSVQTWIHWVIFTMVVLELVYEFYLTDLSGEVLDLQMTFLDKILSNFLILCIFFPPFMVFYIMRDVVALIKKKYDLA